MSTIQEQPALDVRKRFGPGLKSKRIRIEYVDAEAESVGIAGSFNDWRPSVSPMLAVEQGRWVKDLVLHPGTYEYCLVVNGTRWIPDPVSKEKRTNNFGLTNSVIRVSARVQ